MNDYNTFYEEEPQPSTLLDLEKCDGTIKKQDLIEIKNEIKDEIEHMKASLRKEMKDHQEGIKSVLKRMLEELKCLKEKDAQEVRPSISPKKLLAKPFCDIKDFEQFEKSLQREEEKFLQLINDFELQPATKCDKFIKAAWKSILSDEAAQHMCWKGTEAKLSVRPLSVTKAIKCAADKKFGAECDNTFERTCISFFQFAKTRCYRKQLYKSSKGNKSIPAAIIN